MVEDYDNILVPVGGFETAKRAFDRAVKTALDDNAHLDVLDVVDTRQFMEEIRDTLISGNTIYRVTQDSGECLKSLKERAKEHFDFIDASYHIRYGSPKRVIVVDFIKDHHDNLIIMGITSMDVVERMLMGSVTAYVNQHVLSDVSIVKTDIDNKKVTKLKKKLF